MAEGGHSSRTIEDGSDIVYEFECTPCAADGSRFEALHFCQTCDHLLCVNCTKYHQRYTKSHRLSPAGSTKQPSTHIQSKNISYVPKCHFHPDRDIEMYCGTHDMVYCLLCIAKEHRSCSNVEEIEDNVHEPNSSGLQQLGVEFGRVNKELLALKQETSTDLNIIKTKKADLLKEIDGLRKEMNDQLDQLERKVKQDLKAEFTNLEQEIRDDITATNELLTTYNEIQSYLENNKEDKHKFIAEKIGRNIVSEAKAFLMKVNSSKHRRIKFERNERLYDDIKMADNIGKIIRSSTSQNRAKRSKYVVKSSNKLKVNVDTDEAFSQITGICQLQNKTILMADLFNRKLKVLDGDLNVMSFIDLNYEPGGICPISSTEVVTRYSDSVQFIHVGQSLSSGKTIKINALNICYGNNVAFCGGNLWTFGANSLCVYSTAGDLVKTVDTDSNGQKIFPQYHPRSIAVSNDETKVYVTAGADKVVVFYNNGDVIKELRDQRLDDTCGICITEDDTVLVAGYNSKNVVMFDRDGNSLGELVSSKDMLSKPQSLCYERTKCRLLVGFTEDTIQIYELSE